jgi:hypothetical protein
MSADGLGPMSGSTGHATARSWRRALWVAVLVAVVAVTAALSALAPSPACRPIEDIEAGSGGEIANPVMRWVTDTFGAPIGYPLSFIRWRRGYLEDEPAFHARLSEVLEPFDVVILKNGYKLSDKIIPGVFTHAALWLGDEAALREAGLWDYPEVVALHDEIATGHTVIEAEPGGTILANFDRVLDSDELAIIRVRTPPEELHERRCELATIAIAQIGRPYDYSFDADDDDRLSCAEVVTGTFQTVPWQVRMLFGRSTVLPDDLIRIALADRAELDIIAYFAGTSSSGWRELPVDRLEAQLAAACEG